MSTGKEKGYVLYDEVNELLTEEYPGGRELEELLTELDSAGVEILEEPKLEFEKKSEEGEEVELEFVQDVLSQGDIAAHGCLRPKNHTEKAPTTVCGRSRQLAFDGTKLFE